jgi:hypothetical protein
MCSIEDNSEPIDGINGLNCDKENAKLRFSNILFTHSDNESISLKFVMKPCPQRKQVRKLIEFGGGVMARYSDWTAVKAINLVTTNANISDYNVLNHSYYYCNYIYDCCEANQLLDINNYRFKKTTTITKSSDCEDIEDNERNQDYNQWSFDEQDIQILTYISRRKAFADICGNRLWVKAFDDGIHFGQTWESTKDRFFHYIMPNIHNYRIDDLHKQKFLKYCKITTNNNNNKELSQSLESKTNSNTIENNRNRLSFPKIVITTASPKPNSESSAEANNQIEANRKTSPFSDDKNEEKIENNDCGNQPLNESDSLKSFSDKNNAIQESLQTEESSLTKTKDKQIEVSVKKNENLLNEDIDDMTTDSELDFDKDSETKSKYFKNPDSKQTQNKSSEKGRTNAYLEFMKDRSTPEYLQCIKQALRVPKKTNETSIDVSTSKQSRNNITFGAKVLQKINETQSKKGNQINSQESGHKVSDISTDDNSEEDIEVLSVNDSKTNKRLHGIRITQMKSKNKHLSQYSLEEDENIIKYILNSKRFDELKGNSIWEEAQKKAICHRTWQSMKERFKKNIMPNIDSYDFTKKEKSTLKKYFYNEREVDANRATTGYTDEEDLNILRYIINKNGYELVKGNKFWRDMEENTQRNQTPIRSWQSLKERYRKRIIPHLNKYNIQIEFVKKMLNAISWMSSLDKKVLIDKCQKALINTKQSNQLMRDRPQKRQLIVQKETHSTSFQYNSDTELEEDVEQSEKNEKSANNLNKKIKL